MGLDRSKLERQLEIATAQLTACTEDLQQRGVSQDLHRRDARWRSLDADYRQIRCRLRSVGEIETREAECAQRKAAAAEE